MGNLRASAVACAAAAVVLSFTSSALAAVPVIFINEIDFDQPGPVDPVEFVEIAGSAGSTLNGYTLEFMNGATGTPYATIPLPNFTFPDFTNTGWGFFVLGQNTVSPAPNYVLPTPNFIQNGSPDGIRLLDALSNVVHYVTYDGSMPGETDPIPVAVTDSNTVNGSVGKTGPTSGPSSGFWVFAASPTPHFLNGGQDLVPEPAGLALILASAPLLTRVRRVRR